MTPPQSASGTRTWRHPLLRLLAWMLAIVLLLALALPLLISAIDWNGARPYINRQISALSGRNFAIRGDLRVRWQQGGPDETGWRRYLPRPLITASDVHLGNPAWSSTGADLASARRIAVALHPLALLHHRILISELQLEAPILALERRTDGSKSWRFDNASAPSRWRVEILRTSFSDGQLRYLDHNIALDLQARVASIAAHNPRLNSETANAATDASNKPDDSASFGLQFTLGGSYRKAPISGTGKAGGILLLSREHNRYPIQANALLGSNKLAIDGTLTDPLSLAGMDVQLTLGGASMSDLYALTGVLLPATPAYLTRGRLIGTRSTPRWNWRYENFTGTVGQSDLAGSLDYVQQTTQGSLPRPLLRGAITSQQLRLADLGPSIGADSKQDQQARSKALPVAQFNPARWGALDADVSFQGKKLIRSAKIPLQDIVSNIHMNNKVLTLNPLQFGMAGGNINANLRLDGRSDLIQAQLKLAARGIQVRELFPTLKSMQASFGEVNGDAVLSGHGNSVAAMLASADGELGAVVSQGSLSKFMLEAAGLNVANAIVAKLFGDQQVHMNCMVSDFAVTDGRAQVRRFMLDTDDARVDVSGDIDVASEQLNLDIRPKSKGVRIISLRSPLYARGSFSHPDVGPYKGPLALKAATAVALSVVSPIAAVLPLVNLGNVKDGDCAAALALARQTHARPGSLPAATSSDDATRSEPKK